MDPERAGGAYLEHLTEADLRALASSVGLDPGHAGDPRRRPATVMELFDRPELFERAYGPDPDYAQLHAFGPFDAARLLRAAGLATGDETGLVAAPPIRLLEHLGQRWYRRACELARHGTTVAPLSRTGSVSRVPVRSRVLVTVGFGAR